MAQKIEFDPKNLFNYSLEKKPLIYSFVIEGKDIYDAILLSYPTDAKIFKAVIQKFSNLPSEKITNELLKDALMGYFSEKYKKELPEVVKEAIKEFIKKEYLL